jgi:hypothetical protein
MKRFILRIGMGGGILLVSGLDSLVWFIEMLIFEDS